MECERGHVGKVTWGQALARGDMLAWGHGDTGKIRGPEAQRIGLTESGNISGGRWRPQVSGGGKSPSSGLGSQLAGYQVRVLQVRVRA